MADSTILEFPIKKNLPPMANIKIMGSSGANVDQLAFIDTGFSGFLQIPLSVGISCNLALCSIETARLADGRFLNNLQCFGDVLIGQKKISGIITLSENGSECLLGMQFLESLGGKFTVSIEEQKAIFIF